MLLCCCAEEPKEVEIPAPQRLWDPERVIPAAEVTRTQTAVLEKKRAACYVFPVHINREHGTSYGMDVSAAGKVCLVNTVEENSLVGEWNREWVEKASPDQSVQTYDRVLAINDERPVFGKDVLEKLREASGRMTLLMQRPVVSQETVMKNSKDDPLGIDYIEGYGLLLITKIGEGVFQDHNASVPLTNEVKIPSRIVSVNGKRGSGLDLLTWMQEAECDFVLEMLLYDV